MDFGVSSRCADGACVVSVAGEIDIETSPALKAALLDALDESDAFVVVDLSAVGFIDSSGLGVLVGALRRAREAGGDLRLVTPSATVEKVLVMTRLDRVFPLYGTVEEALGA